jgi:hypothetical protein
MRDPETKPYEPWEDGGTDVLEVFVAGNGHSRRRCWGGFIVGGGVESARFFLSDRMDCRAHTIIPVNLLISLYYRLIVE